MLAGLLEWSKPPPGQIVWNGEVGLFEDQLLIRSKSKKEGGKPASLCARQKETQGEKNTQQGHPGPLDQGALPRGLGAFLGGPVGRALSAVCKPASRGERLRSESARTPPTPRAKQVLAEGSSERISPG